MLSAFKKAKSVNGNSQKVMAALCGVTESTFQKWGTGVLRCPDHMRNTVDRAMSEPRSETHLAMPACVNWDEYDSQHAAKQARTVQKAHLAPQPTPKPALPTTAPEKRPQSEKGVMGWLLHDDTGDFDREYGLA